MLMTSMALKRVLQRQSSFFFFLKNRVQELNFGPFLSLSISSIPLNFSLFSKLVFVSYHYRRAEPRLLQ